MFLIYRKVTMSGYEGYVLILTVMEKHRNTVKTDQNKYTKNLIVVVLDSALQLAVVLICSTVLLLRPYSFTNGGNWIK